MPDNKAGNILLELKRSFLDDKKEIQDKIVDIETEIRQCKDYIESLNKKDENDYNMFSPRSASRVYKDQVYEKRLEIEELEEQLRVYYKKLGSVTKKIDSLNYFNASDNVVINPTESEEEPKEEVKEEKPVSEKDSSIFLRLQEQDRQRIAAELHDSVLQNLSLVMHNLELAEKFIDYDAVRAKLELESNRKIVKETIDDIRSTIFDLRPMQFDDFGFKKTLENQLEEYKLRTSMDITYRIDDIDSKDNLILLTIFRIVQELVINSIKHSKGNTINVQVLEAGSGIYIEESDDGIGISEDDLKKDNHFGLKILKERVSMINGSLKRLEDSKGTKIVIELK
ncbi:two-component system, NarL family, sensor histidine kinase DegS [Lachnospiraceae bacterium YSD2013]|nr:two-component system, NarL family, sensor histidine kinase DegS [Lachnospiraceae bacterium YSD2013]